MAWWPATVCPPLLRAALRLERLELREVPADLRVVSYNAASETGTVRPGMVGVLTDADALGAGANVLYVGDFNFYDSDSTEPAYGEFLSAGNAQAVDVANPAGNWKRNSTSWVSLPSRTPRPPAPRRRAATSLP